MGCNCGKTKASQWVHIAPDGKETTYRTDVEARAAQIRQGGTYRAK
jgi:hypothetical protein